MLFKILDRKPGGVLPLELCKEEVKDDYLRERGSELVDRYIDGTLRGRFKVEEFPQNLGQESNARPNTDPTRSQS